MREFMTKMSDYLNEWREDPEKEDETLPRFIIIAVGVAAAAGILMLLWWGYGVQEKKRRKPPRRRGNCRKRSKCRTHRTRLPCRMHRGL